MASRTLLQLRTAVQDHGYGTDTASQQTGFINTEYRRLAGRRRWKWLEAQDSTLSTVVGTAIYTPPMTDLRNIDAVRLSDSTGATYYIEPREEQALRDLYHRDLGINSQPHAWTQYAGKLWLWPTPDQIYNITFDYIKNVTNMVADGDTHLVPEEYDDILVWGAVARSALRARDWMSRTFSAQERDQAEMAMAAEYNMISRQRSDTVEDVLWRPY
jgi:hypothetical protein